MGLLFIAWELDKHRDSFTFTLTTIITAKYEHGLHKPLLKHGVTNK